MKFLSRLMKCGLVSLAGLYVFPVQFTVASVPASDSIAGQFNAHPHETREGEYVDVPRSALPRSRAYRTNLQGFFATQVNVDDSSRNILGDAANEPSIAVDPANPDRMAIGWRQFNTISSNFRQAGYAYTTDGGHTWRFPGVIQPGVFRSDPVLDADAEGNFYYNSLTVNGGNYLCDVFKSTTGGATWDAGTPAFGGDKQWMIIDRQTGQGRGHVYANWTSTFSSCLPGFFTRSTNHGASFQSCIVIPEDPYWGTLAVGPESELYVCGAGGPGFVVARSLTARDSMQNVLWDTATSVNLDGDITAFAGSSSPNPGGLLGQAWIAVDHSSGPTRGYVYVLCSVSRTSNSDPLDVMFARSTDGGLTWSSPVRINDDAGTTAWQWFGTMSVAPGGRIDVTWLDTRDSPGTVNSSLYYSYSTDGGSTWAANVRLSQAFDPHLGWPQQNKMGDYFHMVSDDAGASLAWAGTFNGEQDVYFGRISYPFVGVGESPREAPVAFTLSQNYPNPFNPETIIQFSLPADGLVTLDVFDVLGQRVAGLISSRLAFGNHSYRWNASGLPSGVYYYRLRADAGIRTKKLILLR